MKLMCLKNQEKSWADVPTHCGSQDRHSEWLNSKAESVSRKLVLLWALKEATKNFSASSYDSQPTIITESTVAVRKFSPEQKFPKVLQPISMNSVSNRLNSAAEPTQIQEVNYKYNGSNTPKYSGQFLNLKVGKKVKRQCKLCDLIYTDLKGFNRHYQSVHLNQRHQCGKCYQIFVTPDNLSRHLQKHSSHFVRQ